MLAENTKRKAVQAAERGLTQVIITILERIRAAVRALEVQVQLVV